MFKSSQFGDAILYVKYTKGSVSSNLESQKETEFPQFQVLGDHSALSKSLLGHYIFQNFLSWMANRSIADF